DELLELLLRKRVVAPHDGLVAGVVLRPRIAAADLAAIERQVERTATAEVDVLVERTQDPLPAIEHGVAGIADVEVVIHRLVARSQFRQGIRRGWKLLDRSGFDF